MTLLQVVGGSRPYFARRGAAVFLSVFTSLFSVACRKEEKQAPPPPAAAAPAPADHVAGLPQAPTLQGQLAAESAARVNDQATITLEELTAALQPEGITFEPARQLMGRPHLAIFCARANGTDGLEVTVCEYPSPEAAKAGEAETNKVASKLERHVSRARGKSVLHVNRPTTTPEATVAKVLAAFDKS